MRLAAALLVLIFSATAWGYVPPSEFIVKNMVSKRSAALKSVRVKTHLEAMLGPAGAEKPAGARLTVLTFFNIQSGGLRAFVRDESGKNLYVQDRAPGALPLVDDLLFDSNLNTVIQKLRGAGVPVRTDDELQAMKDEPERRAAEVEFLTRWKNTYAWVIGRKSVAADHSAAPDPQFWVEKDSFGPLRLLVPNGDAIGGMLDARFEGMRFTRGFAFPRTLAIADKDGALILHEELSDLVTNPSPLKGEEAMLPPGFTDFGNAASTEIHSLIQRYFETLR